MCNYTSFEHGSIAVQGPPPTLKQAPPKVGGGLRTATD